jgi:hypothetical protein
MRHTVVNISDTLTATITNGQSLSGGLNLGGLRLFGIVMPAAWTAANLTFLISPDGGVSWNSLFDSNGVELTAAAAASRCITLDPAMLPAAQWLQIRSGTSTTPVTQGADRVLTLILRAV